MSLAQRVRDHRYTKGWGPDELASRAAISRTALYQIESGKTELPRAGTLRRIALALDVSMELLLGKHEMESIAGPLTVPAASTGAVRARSNLDWYPSEGAPLSVIGGRQNGKYEGLDGGNRFAIEGKTSHDLGGRERDLAAKFREILSSPYAEPLARIVEETHRLLPQARAMGVYD